MLLNIKKLTMKNLCKQFSLGMLLIASIAFGQTKPSDLENVGIQHNKMLDTFYNHLKRNNIQKNVGVEVKNVSIEYLSQLQGYSDEDIKLGIEIISKFVEKPTFYQDRLYTEKEAGEISEKAKVYLDSLNSLINNSFDDNFDENVLELENNIVKAELSEKDLTVLFSATNVAKYSVKYWKENYSKWETLSFVTSNKLAKGGPGGRIAGADVAGAVGAAVTTWIVNAAPGAGQVAYGAAIAGGAAGGSVAQGIMELGSYLGVW